MCRRLLLTIVFCIFFGTTLSIRCYAGTDNKCILAGDMKDCGPGEICICAKYRFKCTKDDQACSKQEQSAEITKWAYIVTSKSVCSALQNPMSGASHVKCCSTNRCNQPDNGKCSWSQSRRRALRKFTDLLDF